VARDLIPPPSPAGRPQPEGTPRLVELPPEQPAEPEEPPPPKPSGPSQFRSRFGFILGALAGVVLAAGAVLAIVLTTGGNTEHQGMAANWSSWKPPDTDLTSGPTEIAGHVARKYRLGDGDQLVAVTGGPLQIQDVPLNVALRPPSGDIQIINGHGVLYTLNGLGPRGSIASGKPSEERHLLLRREALELALYSFRYLDGVDMVVALLPPPPPTKNATAAEQAQQQATQALFYRPGDLKPQLQVPLGVTIPAATPRPESFSGDEARKIDSLTRSNLFLASVQQAQDTRAYLVLDRPSG
jgi:hypothetical protein